jgi:hypothetical protein
MTRYLPDHSLSEALIKAYKSATTQKRREVFNLVLKVIGRDESEIASLVVDLCPDDWRVWLAQAKIRQIRVRWCERKGLIVKRLSKDAEDVLNTFMRAYLLAKNESEQSENAVLLHIATMQKDGAYKTFLGELNAQIKREQLRESLVAEIRTSE